jgi:Zinc finger, C2H2 type
VEKIIVAKSLPTWRALVQIFFFAVVVDASESLIGFHVSNHLELNVLALFLWSHARPLIRSNSRWLRSLNLIIFPFFLSSASIPDHQSDSTRWTVSTESCGKPFWADWIISPTVRSPYKCHLPECGRAFIQLSNLQQHLRNHDAQVERAKNRPFHCNICGKGFATESSLRTHTSKVRVQIAHENFQRSRTCCLNPTFSVFFCDVWCYQGTHVT